MIKDKSRKGWFGASDTAMIMGNWKTKTFAMWWLEKCGVVTNSFTNKAMLAGTHYEHKILDYIGIRQKDRQIKIRKYRLRVNLDGENLVAVFEVKTHNEEKEFKVSQAYWQQVQVQMFASGKMGYIVSYGLLSEDYDNYFNPIDKTRLKLFPIEYDADFINNDYLPRLKYLAYCLKKRKFPRIEEFECLSKTAT